MKTPFEILEAPDTATDSEIKSAYLKQVRQFPPDRYPEKFKQIKIAYDQISGEKNRIAYRLFNVVEPDVDGLFLPIIKDKTKETKRIKAEKFLKLLDELAKRELKNKLKATQP
jgi:DnaJ-class molecular chaperone